MSTTTRVTTDPGEFKATAFPFLQGDPVLHTVLLSQVQDRIRGLFVDQVPAVFLSVHAADGEVIGAALRTAGRGIYLGGLTAGLAPQVFDAYAAATPDTDVVEGSAPAARIFAEHWSSRFGKKFEETRGTRLHKLGRFVEQRVEGTARQATKADLEVAARWMGAFSAEVGMPSILAEDKNWARSRIGLGRLWLWEDGGRPVSMVGHQDTVFGSTRIGPVYTPAEHRGHGYGSALTAFVSRRIRDSGSAVCLFTDVANPTSNKIYAAIGYEPITDFVRYNFS